MRIIKSVNDKIHTYFLENFQKTSYSRFIKSLKDIHKGESCVIAGNGPSLSSDDLEVLYRNNVISFGMNRIFNIFEKTNWRPTYYFCEDPVIMNGIIENIEKIPAKYKFIPIHLKWDNGMKVKNAKYFKLDFRTTLEDTYNISLDPSTLIKCRSSVTISCIQMALWMGFSKIYLIGVDNNYSIMIDDNGNVVEDKNVKDYFSDDYDKDLKNIQVRNIQNVSNAFKDLKRLSEKLGTFKIYNATRGGKLETFERVEFDSLFKKENN